MKKKILIVNNNMHIGGVQKALANLLSEVHEKYDITLLLFHPEGEYMKNIPDDVKVLAVKSGYKYLGMTKYDVKGHPFWHFKRSFYASVTRLIGRNAAIRLMSVFQRKVKGFDAVVSYLQNGGDKAFYGGCNDFVIKHTVASKRISVLHCDYLKCGANTQKNKKLYSCFDLIAACSEGCRDSFVTALPELADKTAVVKNCHDFAQIDKLSREEDIVLSRDKINILSVARLGREKGVLRAVRVVSKLGEYKDKVSFYIIGDGIERAMIEDFIKNEALEDTVKLLGERANPYPYMRACDLFLISSYSEAAPMVIGESAYLGTPILSTNTSSAVEMIEDTGYGWVCENSEEDLLLALTAILSSSEKIKEKALCLSALKHDNCVAQQQFDKIIK